MFQQVWDRGTIGDFDQLVLGVRYKLRRLVENLTKVGLDIDLHCVPHLLG